MHAIAVMRVFNDRRDAGAQLARELHRFAEKSDVVVLALPRGGVPVGYEIATRLGVPLDVLIVRKVGVPFHPELAMGAIASGGVQVIDEHLTKRLRISPDEFEEVAAIEREELSRRERVFRGERAALDVRGRTVLLVDDGLATGSTMAAAIAALRLREPAKIVVTVPVGAPQTVDALRAKADEVVCLHTPQHLYAVGIWYNNFTQTTDDEVRDLLATAERLLHTHYPSSELRLR